MVWHQPESDEVEFLKELRLLSDRVVGLLAPVLVERRLSIAVKVKSANSARSGRNVGELSFGNQIKLGLELGIYGDETYRDLRSIQGIRNHFAHELVVKDFSAPLVVDLLNNIGVMDRWPKNDPDVWAKGVEMMPLNPFKFWLHVSAIEAVRQTPEKTSNPPGRYKFLRSCEMLSYLLYAAARANMKF